MVESNSRRNIILAVLALVLFFVLIFFINQAIRNSKAEAAPLKYNEARAWCQKNDTNITKAYTNIIDLRVSLISQWQKIIGYYPSKEIGSLRFPTSETKIDGICQQVTTAGNLLDTNNQDQLIDSFKRSEKAIDQFNGLLKEQQAEFESANRALNRTNEAIVKVDQAEIQIAKSNSWFAPTVVDLWSAKNNVSQTTVLIMDAWTQMTVSNWVGAYSSANQAFGKAEDAFQIASTPTPTPPPNTPTPKP
mgnify:CR=1 FL=1